MRIAVLASGSGTNLQALIDAAASGRLGSGRIVLVVSDRPAARALERARSADIPAVALPPHPGEGREAYDARLRDVVAEHRPDLVVLAGWMRILSTVFVHAHRCINLHPARPGELPGVRAIERAHAEFVEGRRTRSGVMVHAVPDAGVDSGPVLAAVDVPLHPDDTLSTFAERMHAAEHRLLVDTVARLCTSHPEPTPTGALE
jgi:phosphoribosylglycinamide formyltransferase-1